MTSIIVGYFSFALNTLRKSSTVEIPSIPRACISASVTVLSAFEASLSIAVNASSVNLYG